MRSYKEISNFTLDRTKGKIVMGYDPDIHHRRSIRLKGYDYRQPGMYFVTICSWERQPLFDLPELRGILLETWEDLPSRFSTVAVDTFVVMPDHVHGIFHLKSPIRYMKSPAVDDVMRVYKSITSVQWIRLNKNRGTRCARHLWQERFYDHVIRNEKDLQRIREYILNNPLKPELLQGKDIEDNIWEEIINCYILRNSGES